MKKIHYIILLLLMPLALGAQSISPTCRTCGKKIALCPYKGKHPTKQSQSRHKKDGFSIEVYPDGSEFRGTFKDGHADGFYMYVQKGGGYRIGKFENGKVEGHSLYFGDDGKPMYALSKDDKCVETTDLTATSRPGTYSYKHSYYNGTYVE